MTTISTVTKMNKGSSRDQWGSLNYHSYKTQDGRIRARLYAYPNNTCKLEVKQYTKPTSRWGTRLTWDEDPMVGECHIDVADFEKGLKTTEIMPEINAIIEVYNDEVEKNLGRLVQTRNWDDKDWAPEPYTIGGLYVTFDADNVMSTTYALHNELIVFRLNNISW